MMDVVSMPPEHLVLQLNAEVEELQDANAQLENTNHRLEDQNRELRTICAVLTYLNGRDVGLGSFQVRLPVDVAFEVRHNLPANPHVVLDHVDGALVITVV